MILPWILFLDLNFLSRMCFMSILEIFSGSLLQILVQSPELNTRIFFAPTASSGNVLYRPTDFFFEQTCSFVWLELDSWQCHLCFLVLSLEELGFEMLVSVNSAQLVSLWEAQWCRGLIFIACAERRIVGLHIQWLSNNLWSQVHLFQHWPESRYAFLSRMASGYLDNFRVFLDPAQKDTIRVTQ